MSFSLSQEELEFLGAHVRLSDNAWEWGTGASTIYLAGRCRRLVSVEHDAMCAIRSLSAGNVYSSVLYVPQDMPMIEHTDDGDLDSFRHYVEVYTGKGVDIVLIDGRARVACARQVAEAAAHGPHPAHGSDPGTRIFLHDWERPEYARIWKDRETDDGVDGYFRRVEVVGRLMRMEPRL